MPNRMGLKGTFLVVSIRILKTSDVLFFLEIWHSNI